jgi:hypothetical protein
MNLLKHLANLILQYNLTIKKHAKENFMVRLDFNDGKHATS